MMLPPPDCLAGIVRAILSSFSVVRLIIIYGSSRASNITVRASAVDDVIKVKPDPLRRSEMMLPARLRSMVTSFAQTRVMMLLLPRPPDPYRSRNIILPRLDRSIDRSRGNIIRATRDNDVTPPRAKYNIIPRSSRAGNIIYAKYAADDIISRAAAQLEQHHARL
ncbi:hypothetical protein FRC12_003176 [Ceratobasidium sp. 428]|nr:hypothetical protein FRC12_003176 [Ceratobasidium sp. 428]